MSDCCSVEVVSDNTDTTLTDPLIHKDQPPRGALPVHGAGLGPAVGHGVEEAAHAGVLVALLCRAEVVVHHLVLVGVGDATAAVRDPGEGRERSEAGDTPTRLTTP